jgi:hypothetical protein
MSENIEKFGKPGKKRGKLPESKPGIITIVHAGLPYFTEPVEIDVLNPKTHMAIQFVVSPENSDVIDLNALINRRDLHCHIYEIGLLQVDCDDFSQRGQFFSFYKNFSRETKAQLLLPYEPLKKSTGKVIAEVKEPFEIGDTQKLLYRVGVGKKIVLSFWPSKRLKFR